MVMEVEESSGKDLRSGGMFGLVEWVMEEENGLGLCLRLRLDIVGREERVAVFGLGGVRVKEMVAVFAIVVGEFSSAKK